jgi:hypothetical protein
MGMRMEPVRASAIDNLKFVDFGFPWMNRLHRMTITALRHARSMRMDNAVFGKVIVEIDSQFRSAFGADNGSKITPRDRLDRYA